MKLEDKYYSIDDLAKMFSLGRHYIWRLVSICTICNHSYGKCTCGNFTPAIQSINIGPTTGIGLGIRKNYRITHSEVIKRLKKYNPDLEVK